MCADVGDGVGAGCAGVQAASGSARSAAMAAAGIRRRTDMGTTVGHGEVRGRRYPQPYLFVARRRTQGVALNRALP
ncbi:hypothetical protein GCM10028798_20510 [Humibacter antri]